MVPESLNEIAEKTLQRFFKDADYYINNEWLSWKSYYKIFAQPQCMWILNSYFWYDFTHCEKVNEKAIDWYDFKRNIWIQVTNRIDKTRKFKEDTIDKINSLTKYPDMAHLKFFVLRINWDTYASWTDLNIPIVNNNWNAVSFNNIEDILTFDSIINRIASEVNPEVIMRFINTLIDIFPKQEWSKYYTEATENGEREKINVLEVLERTLKNKTEQL
ncbi:MAG: hypothetical protein ACD_4C00185G0002 [uncultured bacterium (gcode 4)]|uniref:SMEK domain-containing protein n=1 Tax=uncultured bacterium (gcode 4) TaxID=1234023 RepID=K2G992_9BACT|nr:MAG: hypothetical protein ACD_4C00185G0002 [uncultured bacterium (gcode 4)]